MILKIPTVRLIFINGRKKVQHWNLTLIFHIILRCSMYKLPFLYHVLIFLTNFKSSNIVCLSTLCLCEVYLFKTFFTFGFRFSKEEDNIFFVQRHTVTERKDIEVKNKLWFWLAIYLCDWGRWLNLHYIYILMWEYNQYILGVTFHSGNSYYTFFIRLSEFMKISKI